MNIIKELKEKDLLSHIEFECGTNHYNAGSDTVRYKSCPICGNGDHFNVNTKGNYYNSFGNACGSGSIIDFHMNLNNVDMKTAIKELAEYYNFSFNSKEEAKNMTKELKAEPKVISEDKDWVYYDNNTKYNKWDRMWFDMPTNNNDYTENELNIMNEAMAVYEESNNDFAIYEQELRNQNKKPELENADKNIISKTDLNQLFNDYITKQNDTNIDYFISRLLNNYKYTDNEIVSNFERLLEKHKFMTVNPLDLFSDNKELLPIPNYIKDYENVIPILEDGTIVNCILRGNKELDQKIKSNDKMKLNKTMNLKGLPVKLFNADYLKQNKQEIYITEGIFDCLSLECLGYNSICLNSVNMYNKLIEAIKANIDTCQNTKFVLCLDNDKKGIEVSNKLKELLNELNIKNVGFSFNCDNEDIKDINDYYLKDLAGLKQDLEYLFKPKTIKSYLNTFRKNQISNKYRSVISTGFDKLDTSLNGGFYSGLYVIGAISSLGKTALTLQIADNIARSKQHVLFFSLEMPTDELISRSLSRKMFVNNKCKEVGTMRVLNGYLDNVQNEFENAFTEYANNEAEYLSIIEGNFSFDIDSICDYVYKFVLNNEIKPVVFVDYLQIIKASKNDKFSSEKEKIDNIVVKLKMLSRDCNIPVMVVSSFNRESYESPVSYACFKESGGIEYTADFVLGLQLTILDQIQCDKNDKNKINKKLQIDNAKAGINGMREVTLKILKNRNGESNTKVDFRFYAKNNLFEECTIRKDLDF